MPVGVIEEHDPSRDIYHFVLPRGGSYTQYVRKGRPMVVYPVGTSIASVGPHLSGLRHQVIEPMRAWLCTNLSGRFSVRPHWMVWSHTPITIVFHDASAAMMFKMRWL